MRKLILAVITVLIFGSFSSLYSEDTAVCSQCGGTGTIEVEYEDTCGSCNGTGYAACSSCGGTGETKEPWYPECEVCRGSGVRNDQPCIGCGGTGFGRENYGCRECGGTGLSRAACTACDGYGTVITIEKEPCPGCTSSS